MSGINDQEYRLGFTVDTAQVDPATKKVRELRKELQDLERSDFFTGRAAVRMDLSRQLAAAERGLAGFKAQAVDTGRASGQAAYGMLALANATQDFAAAGIRGAVNNVPMLVMGLGGPAGLAAKAMFAAVGVDVLTQNWSKLEGLFAQSKVETQAERMERLAAATKLTATETKELAAHQERERSKASTENSPSARQAAAAGEFQRMEKELGGPASVAQIAAAMDRESGLPSDPANDTPYQKAVREKNRGDAATALKRAQGAGGKLSQQERARQVLDNLGVRPPDANRGVPDVDDPAKVAEYQAREREKLGKALDEQIKKEKELIETLNREGQANERLMREEQERTREAERRQEIERVRERAGRRERRGDELQRRAGGPMPYLAEYMSSLTLGRQYGGEGLNIAEAADFTRRQIAQQAQRSYAFGGLGLNRQGAMELATRQVNDAFNDAAQMSAMQNQMFPDAPEMIRQMKEMVSVQRQALYQGVPIRLRRVGWR